MADQTTQMFLFLESAKSGVIKGETMDAAHTNEILIESFSWAVKNPNVSHKENDKPKADYACVRLTMRVSKASTFLMRAASEGLAFKRATISMRKHGAQKSGEANGDFLQFRMHNAYVASYELGSGHGEGSDHPIESIDLCYDKVEAVYLEQDQKGAMSQMFQHGWDVGQNKQLSEMTLPYKGGGAKAS